MNAPHIHPRYRTVSASLMLETLGESLEAIKKEDRATFRDMGVVLGKSGDRAESYAKGDGDMGVVSFLRGCGKWDGRFANASLALVGMKLVPLEPENVSDRATFTALCGLLHEMSAALENDGVVDDQELAAMRPAIETASRCIDRLRERLKPRSVRDEDAA